jgi:hypothetical protein
MTGLAGMVKCFVVAYAKIVSVPYKYAHKPQTASGCIQFLYADKLYRLLNVE